MTYFEAVNIKRELRDFVQFAEWSIEQKAFIKAAKKYTKEQLTEAMIVINKKIDEEKDFNESLFILAIRSRENI